MLIQLEHGLQHKCNQKIKYWLEWPIAIHSWIFLFYPVDPNNQKHTEHGNGKMVLKSRRGLLWLRIFDVYTVTFIFIQVSCPKQNWGRLSFWEKRDLKVRNASLHPLKHVTSSVALKPVPSSESACQTRTAQAGRGVPALALVSWLLLRSLKNFTVETQP